ncbi:YiiX/YebB-like N1pC/P60 family cysteine hydrolase [Rhodoferax sp.]|uniref:YiiX/YebB-like N1pC/P60 family cysteine hydrolase n=1 Tax=Rhodoferax sp. TaxID=50421 RepID=UPI00283D9FC0|nr:YiiX/YebB-like N1pC/P60 family cysteine hydrolase [Rhodoferax sp.]MDR3368843.1 YiiX/YebB-like N1pC/P60 family cysteine hydrolase [Rhodoferax sp.]
MADKTEQKLIRVRYENLQSGDVILTTTRQTLSKLIRKVTNSDISHAMVCVAGGSVMDSTAEGVHARNVLRLVFHADCAVHVLRAEPPLSTEEVAAVVTYARSQNGARYTKVGAVQSIVGVGKVGAKQFCSRLVAQAYRHAGVQLVDDADYCHPGELLTTKRLVEVPDMLCEATDAYVRASEEEGDLTQQMRAAINEILNEARKLDSSIEHFDDLNRHLLAHPENDGKLCDILENSGYLSLWQVELNGSPWYSLVTMRALPQEQVDVYAAQLLSDDDLGPNRFILNRGGYMALTTHTALRYFGRMLDLNERLAALHATRVRVAREYLVERGLLEPEEKLPPLPHTKKWFEALRHWDPKQAALTEYVLSAEGTHNCCTICGDTPAGDFRAPDGGEAGGPGSYRLCDDCARIQRSMYDTVLIPWPKE